jgi:hypothetical protein
MLISNCLDLAVHGINCDFEVDTCGWRSFDQTNINPFRLFELIDPKLQNLFINIDAWYRTKISNIDDPALKGKVSMSIACKYLCG